MRLWVEVQEGSIILVSEQGGAMVQETRYSLLSDYVSLVQQRLDDHVTAMEMISRWLEQLDSSMKAMQVAMEGRLPTQQPSKQQQQEYLPQ